uniref:Uncharacterized protein n=1 Tax=Thermocrispum agreste TaxID=37925 RepID=A0A2W4J5N4_9PSEU|nr:MAG: hypothetical protein DIU77_15165 [Thermocrispum agreste]
MAGAQAMPLLVGDLRVRAACWGCGRGRCNVRVRAGAVGFRPGAYAGAQLGERCPDGGAARAGLLALAGTPLG